MSLFAIADLHLSLGTDKPMDVFGGWENYVERLKQNWRTSVAPSDTVVVPGDISWAMSLEGAVKDFAFLDSLPGQKILLKGNHDYWWSTMSKMTVWLKENGFSSIRFLHNNSYMVEGVSICGTRSWMNEPGKPQDAKVMAREVGRLRMSLEAATEQEKLVFLHYPPVCKDSSFPELIALMKEHEVKRCFFGHLHGASARWATQGRQDGIEYTLLSADSIGFNPQKVAFV